MIKKNQKKKKIKSIATITAIKGFNATLVCVAYVMFPPPIYFPFFSVGFKKINKQQQKKKHHFPPFYITYHSFVITVTLLLLSSGAGIVRGSPGGALITSLLFAAR